MSNESTLTVTDRDGIVAFPDGPPAGRFSGAVAVIVVVIFLAVLVGTSLVDLLAPAPFPTLIGAEKRQDARLREQAQPWDGSLFRLWEHDLRLRSRVRRSVTDVYGWFLYRSLGKLQGNIVVGPNGWLFLAARTTIPEQTDGELARRAGAVMAAVDRRIHASGMDAVVIPVPRKAAVHAIELPRRVDARPEADRAVFRELTRRGLVVADLWTAFGCELSDPAFHMLGSHWTDEAQLVAARVVAATCGLSGDPDGDGRTLSSVGPTVVGVDTDLLRLGGILGDYQLPERAARKTYNLVASKGVNLPPLVEDEAGRVVIIGTSFTHRRKFPAFIAHYLDEGIWSGARAGTFPGDALAAFMRMISTPGATELVLLEVPCHHLVKQPDLAIADPIFAERPPKRILRYRDIGGSALLVPSGETAVIGRKLPVISIPLGPVARREGRGLPLVHIPEGSIAHSGDGVVALRIRGSSSAGVMLRLETAGGVAVTIPWASEVEEVNMPLLSPETSSEAIRLMAFLPSSEGKRAEVTVDSIQVVSEVPHLPRVDIAPGPPEKTATGWELVLEPESLHLLGPLSLLELGLGAKGSFSGLLHVEVQCHGAESFLEAEWTGLSKGALVVVSLAPLRGQSIARIRLTGSGDPPQRLLHRAVLRLGT